MAKIWLVSAASVALLGGGAYFYLQSSTQPEAFPTLAVEKG
ncbi:efflux RND transporter periplasmic adaptor subunit, partial [Vibrio sp. 10N.222.55.E8]